MNNAWKFKGYDNPNTGEAARRIALARNMLGQFEKGGNPDVGDGKAGPLGGPAGNTPMAASNPEVSRAKTIADMMAALQTGGGEDGWGKMDMNLPQAPSPVPPRPGGDYNPDANMMKLMMMMLAGGGGGQIPSLASMMGRA